MITVYTENYNLISQDFYNKTIDSLDLNLISCTCGHSGCLIRYGSYIRNVQLTDRVLSLSVVRVYCKTCGHTHALLLSSMVPYSQIPLVLHVRLIHAYEHETGFRNILAEQYLVDENNLKSIIRNYLVLCQEKVQIKYNQFSLCLAKLNLLFLSHFLLDFSDILPHIGLGINTRNGCEYVLYCKMFLCIQKSTYMHVYN